MKPMTIDALLEAVLFWRGEPTSIKKLSEILEKDKAEVEAGLVVLKEKLEGRGITLITKEDEVMLGTDKEASGVIEKLTKDELMRDLGKAGLETLSIVIYRGPIARRDIDYIRGVNSNFILRNLMIRGLVEKVQSPTDQRSFLYKPTFELLSYMGVSKIEDLPEYGVIAKEVVAFAEKKEEGEQTEEQNGTNA